MRARARETGNLLEIRLRESIIAIVSTARVTHSSARVRREERASARARFPRIKVSRLARSLGDR